MPRLTGHLVPRAKQHLHPKASSHKDTSPGNLSLSHVLATGTSRGEMPR
jgi:hypothetical protein